MRVTKGRFLNQKLGKRTDRKSQLLKARLKAQRPPAGSGRKAKPTDTRSSSG